MAEPQNFAEWAAHVREPKPAHLEWPDADIRTCVVTVATAYPVDVLKPLVLSLQAACHSTIVLATDQPGAIKAAFPGPGVVVYPVRASAGYRPYPALARLEYYLQILASLPKSVERVLLVDSRDVLFQADPFAGLSQAPLEFFAENNETGSWNLLTTNGRWARMMLPKGLSRTLQGRPIVNGGVIAGTPRGLRSMCHAKLDIALSTHEWTKHTTGLDNISTNVVAHAGMVGHSTVTANHTQVANIYRDTPMSLNQEGCMVSPGGMICPVIHMYDRKPDLLEHVNQRYGVDDNGLVLGQDRSLSKPKPLSGLRHWLKLARIRLTAS